jgi:hypothetical protein
MLVAPVCICYMQTCGTCIVDVLLLLLQSHGHLKCCCYKLLLMLLQEALCPC